MKKRWTFGVRNGECGVRSDQNKSVRPRVRAAVVLLGALGLLLAAAFAVWLWTGDRGLGTDPRGLTSYAGKSLRDWAVQYADANPAAQAARDQAHTAFAAMGTNAIPELIRLVNTDDPLWRQQLYQPGAKWPKQTREFLTAHVDYPNLFQDRQAAVRVLADYGPKAEPAIPALVNALSARQGSLCTDAAVALSRIGKPAVPALLRAARSRDGWTRRWAIYALQRLGPTAGEAVPVLVERLQDPEADVRERAVQALGEMGPAAGPAIQSLRAIAQDAQAPAGLRAAAREALGKIEGVE